MQSAGPLLSRAVYFLGVAPTTLAVADTAVGIAAASVPAGATGFIAGNITADCNWLLGANPTGSAGIPLPLDSTLVVEDMKREDILALRFIQQSAGTTLVFQWLTAQQTPR